MAHEFGTDPSSTRYPAKAVDTTELPNIVVRAQDPSDLPLRYYQIDPNTYLFYRNIAEVDENNRGWNGNAGFIVTPQGVVAIDALGTPKPGERMIATIRRVTEKPIK